MLLRQIYPLVCLLVLPAGAKDDHFQVTGVPVDPRAGSVPLRKSINEVTSVGGAQWDLYIRSLKSLQEVNHEDQLSYFQIAGVHGKPYIEWNNAGRKNTDGWQGYCPHSEKLFLPWHRAYLMLFEQLLVEHAKRHASEYPQRYRYEYMQAAETLRSPYWDWALDIVVPQATVPETVLIRVPKGEVLQEVNVSNPLATFKYPQQAIDGGYGDFDSLNRTQIYRCPSPENYPGTANQNIAGRPYRSWVYNCFTSASNFSEFASTGDGGISLEQIHNAVHWDAACAGQFLATDFSAFDPLFLLHHTNVDRLWAYWQAISPGHAIFQDSYEGGARYSTPSGTVITPDSALAPFFRNDSEFHTTRSVANIKGLGYSYLGLEYWDKSNAQMAQDAKKLIHRLYGPDQSQIEQQLVQINGSLTSTRYMARLQLNVAELDRPCTVELYVGQQHGGSFVVMAQPKTGIVHGGIPLDDTLQNSKLGGMTTVDTVRSLQGLLTLAVINGQSERIPLDSISGFKIEIEGIDITRPLNESDLPIRGASRMWPVNATENSHVQ